MTTPGAGSPARAAAAEGPPLRLRISWFGHAGGRRADGLTSYSAATVQALRRRGADVQFFAHRSDGLTAPSPRSVQVSALRFKTVRIPMPGTKRRIARELALFRPDIVHISLSFSLLDCWIARHAHRLGARVVATVHLPYASPRSARGRVLRGLYRFHVRGLRNCDRCVALSQEQRDLLVSVGCPGERIVVIPNGVDTQRITPGESRFRDALNARFVVAYMGRLDPEKRVTALVRTFRALAWPDDHVLVVAGRGAYEKSLRRLSRRWPSLHFVGPVTDRDEYLDILRAADVFVLPSTAEALSLSLLEAMSAGCAVIATDVAETGAAMGDAGLRLAVRPLEPSLARALRTLRDDPDLRQALGRRARARALQHFSLQTRIDHLVQLYAEIAQGVAPAA